VLEPVQPVGECRPVVRGQARERLVHEDGPRARRYHHGELHQALLAVRQGTRRPIRERLEPEGLEQLARLRCRPPPESRRSAAPWRVPPGPDARRR
jgi:hypothetical protein